MTAHAIFGGSGANRWMHCAGSVQASSRVQPQGSSGYALEGSAAHALGEACLRFDLLPDAAVGGLIKLDCEGNLVRIEWPNKEITKGDAKFRAQHTFPVDFEMAHAVRTFTDDVRADLAELAGAGTRLYIEEKLNLGPLTGRKDMFGTADAIIVEPYGTLVVNDYKHGKGVVVEVEENEQLKFYAVGALAKFGTEFQRVRIKVTQPRAPHADGPVRTWETTVPHLLSFAGMLKLAAEAAEKPDAPLVPGDWCRFCPAKAGLGMDGKPVQCPALKEQIQRAVQVKWDSAAAPTPPEGAILPASGDYEQIARALTIVPMLDSWARDVEGLAQRAMEAGHHVPGFKLVRKRANRRWKDPEKVEQVLRNKQGVKMDDIAPRKLGSPAQLEKNPAIGEDWVEKYSEKPEGGLTVAKESDKREAVKRERPKYTPLPATTEDPE